MSDPAEALLGELHDLAQGRRRRRRPKRTRRRGEGNAGSRLLTI